MEGNENVHGQPHFLQDCRRDWRYHVRLSPERAHLMKRYDLDSLDNRSPELIARAWRRVGPIFKAYFRPVVHGLDRIPSGPALYVGNHNGSMSWDSFTFFGEVLEQRGIDYVPYALGHDITLRLPPFHQLFVRLGAIRATHDNAHRVLERGNKLLVYPGSDYDTFRSYRNRDRVIFGPRRGYIRLALRERVPIVPVVSAGAHAVLYIVNDGQWIARAFRLDRIVRAKAWPIALSIPWGLTVGPPPPYIPWPSRFFQEAVAPISFERTGPEASDDNAYVERCHATVLSAMQQTMDRLAAERRAAARSSVDTVTTATSKRNQERSRFPRGLPVWGASPHIAEPSSFRQSNSAAKRS